MKRSSGHSGNIFDQTEEAFSIILTNMSPTGDTFREKISKSIALLAQSVERTALNRVVAGSSPAWGTYSCVGALL